MKVLIIGSFLSSQIGVKGTSEILADLFVELGWSVLTTSRQPSRILRILDMLYTSWRRRNEYSVVLLDVFSGWAFLWAEIVTLFLKSIGKPVCVVLRGGGLPDFLAKHPARVQKLLHRVDLVTTPSKYVRNALSSHTDDIVFLPNGIDINKYTFRHRSNTGLHIGWLRAFHHIYNPVLAVQSLGMLRDRFPKIQLTMIGPDKNDGTKEVVDNIIANQSLASHINIVGPVAKANVPEWLDKVDIFINTTNVESFGVGVLEAGASGLPIVSTSVGELPLLWSNEEDALLVPVNDAHQMAEAISRILTEPGLAEKLSRNARMKAERYDWKTILPEWEKLLDQTIENSRKRKQ